MLLCKVVSIASGFDCADVVLVTAISEEQKAMKKCFGVGFETQLRDGIHYSVGTLKKMSDFCELLLCNPRRWGLFLLLLWPQEPFATGIQAPS